MVRNRSYRVFERRYEPFSDQMMDSVPEGTPDNHVWSVLDCDGKLVISPGYAVVNWMGYLVTRNPWPDSEFTSTGYIY